MRQVMIRKGEIKTGEKTGDIRKGEMIQGEI